MQMPVKDNVHDKRYSTGYLRGEDEEHGYFYSNA
jgi:hypothetical protein